MEHDTEDPLLSIAASLGMEIAPKTVIADGLRLSWGLKGAWLLQHSKECGFHDPCKTENIHAIILLILLCATILAVVCTFGFINEDKEDDITPLSPQLLVKEEDLFFTMPIDVYDDKMSILNTRTGDELCHVIIDWPSTTRESSTVIANVKLLGVNDYVLATVVARNTHVAAQSFALCRQGCEIFGFVEPDGPQQYHVRHRTGGHLLTLTGDFGPTTTSVYIEGTNSMGSHVCWVTKNGNSQCVGRVLQNVDAGLVVASLLATYVHRRLSTGAQQLAPMKNISVINDTSSDEPPSPRLSILS